MTRYGRRRRQRQIYLGNFYLNPNVQYTTTIVSAIALAGLVFSGLLLFRFTDQEDLISRGKMQLRTGKVAFAQQTFQTLVNNHPRSYEGHLLLGQAFMALEKRTEAEQQFTIAASLRSNDPANASAEIALSKVAMAQNDFEGAERLLLKSWQSTRRQDKDVKQALFEMYEQWGNHLQSQEKRDYAQIISKYEFALHYVKDYDSEQMVKEKLIEAMQVYTDQLITLKNYPEATKILKQSLRLKYLPDTLARIADVYERQNQGEQALEWYKKAYEINPQRTGLRYTQALIKQAQALTAAKKKDEAAVLYAEADKVSKQSNLPLASLYPVTVNSVKISYDIDEATGEFDPAVQVRFANDASRPVNYLMGKAEFMSGDQVISTTTVVIADHENPLPLKGDKKSARVVVFKPNESLSINALEGNKFTVKISVTYEDSVDPQWKVKTIQEAVLKSGGETTGRAKPV